MVDKIEETNDETKNKPKTKSVTLPSKQTFEEENHLVYIGPRLDKGRLRTYQIFVGGYPDHLQDLYDKYPQLKSLFVPVTQLSQAQIDVAVTGHPLNVAYKIVKEVK
ncbi:hypothetical protein P4H71_06970 [Paenibacillus kribbensis]|uniref:hypothetical protein n=1 Tax=Paenibacillus kribbensis TaxID=172713 RepID=UPI002DB88701|nr:hypothetical protein [Paenibacillus kribbensis]MEC0234072.1 hypothetical protein [Paenibacillus kribbensis]